MKFQRVYRLSVQVSETEFVAIEYPLTLMLDISRGVLRSANHGRFQIYNLNPSTRTQIYHDRYDIETYRAIVLQAGYESQSPLPIIFKGNIQAASSYRQGVNWVTEIEALDGGFGIINGQVSQTVPAGWTLPAIIQTLLKSIPHVAIGAVGSFTEQNSRGITLMGNSWDLASSMASGQNTTAFIDNEMASFLSDDEYILDNGGVTLIESDTGLLATPRRYDARIDVQIIFEPRLQIGQLVQLNSAELANLQQAVGGVPGNLKYLAVNNGQYKIMGIQHQGTISGAVGDRVVTTASLFLGTQALRGVALA